MKQQESPLRNYIFYGLTLVLASAFIFLAIQNNPGEKVPINPGKEVLQDFEQSPVRALAPKDLEIKPDLIPLTRDNRTDQPPRLLHPIIIYNSGGAAYQEILLKLNYEDEEGRVLSATTHSILQQTLPGKSFLPVDIPTDSIPSEAAACRLSVVYADMKPEEIKNR